ncbi:hypothetical protein J8C02_14180 [Chloracidobacterium sp. MS 40/45]|uniref:hypothetical protein n=1 Tax=Chloracidobacterium aggregatum TaxID=2851959 RepID=UPI001B8C9FED|nr:hypothetical protein [Chloracidobacterium aggregatum]QUW01284.1 hypothetical protein J8C02_14180 [Chloracidobacterium sp. MS 40/45]
MRCFSMWRRCACPVVVITGFVGITSGNVTPGVSVRASANAFTSGGSGGVVSTPGPEARDDFTISRSVRGELRAIRNSSITLRDAKGRETTLVFNRETRFRAEDKSAFGGRSRLTADDLAPGLPLRVLYREKDQTALEIKVLKPRP